MTIPRARAATSIAPSRTHYHGGDFEGIIQHLPYLKDLGVTALWLTPIYDNSNALRPTTTATARWTSTAWRSTSARWINSANW